MHVLSFPTSVSVSEEEYDVTFRLTMKLILLEYVLLFPFFLSNDVSFYGLSGESLYVHDDHYDKRHNEKTNRTLVSTIRYVFD